MARHPISKEPAMGCAISRNQYRWPNRTIPFEINGEFPAGSPERTVIFAAISEWNSRTVVSLVRRTNEIDYIEFVRGDDCSSLVGRRGGRQPVTCSFTSEERAIHEIGHAVGLWHEQQRQDRNLFVVVHPENVRPGDQRNFEMRIDDGSAIGPYDYSSMMHYGRRGRAVDWRAGSVVESQLSKAAPALATFGSGLHMVHLDDASNDIWWSIFDGNVWRRPDGAQGDVRIPGQQSKVTPALAVFNNRLHMVHLGDTSNDIWWSIYDGTSWNTPDGTPGNVPIPGQLSKGTPALAAYNNRLHMVHLDNSSNELWWSIYDGTSWNKPDGTPGNVRIPNQHSKAPPALAVFDNQLHMVHLGTSSNDIWWSIYDGNVWRRPDGAPGNVMIPNRRSMATPGLAAFGSSLHMVHIGDTSNDMWTSRMTQSEWNGDRRRYNGQSKAGPAMAALGGRLYMLHAGNDSNRIWQTMFDPSLLTIEHPPGVTIGGQQQLSDGDVQAVAIAYA
jgi:hypothetical protein